MKNKLVVFKEKETKEKVVESKNYLTEPESQPRFSKENSP